MQARELAGFPATWTTVDVHVEDEMAGTALRARCSLYTIAQPERWIDSKALLRESEIADPPYWAIVWTGARAIAAVLLHGPSLHRRRVLDLGCGLGLSGLAAARAGAEVVFADYLDEPLKFVGATVDAGSIEGARVVRLDFTRDRLDERFDVILAADVVYEPSQYAPLAEFLAAHLADDGRILLTESLRADARIFLAGMKDLGFDDRVRPLWVHEEGRRERTWLHELQRRA
ncbi:MAG TPA: methyltransferase domain-containing protein [Candidatus Limnocylindrales bacterium]|nr:methyltransferase domain-containing protein [Candidatus Limnocylindrales bacterium]